VTAAAVADEVDHDVALELLAVGHGEVLEQPGAALDKAIDEAVRLLSKEQGYGA
jgi:hypothetical protein